MHALRLPRPREDPKKRSPNSGLSSFHDSGVLDYAVEAEGGSTFGIRPQSGLGVCWNVSSLP